MSRTKTITTTAATFGAALTSLYAAPELQADITDLTFRSKPRCFAVPQTDDGTSVTINSGTAGNLGAVLGSFQVYNAFTAQTFHTKCG